MSYIKFTKTFLDTIAQSSSEEISTLPRLTKFVNTALKTALFGNYSYYLIGNETNLKEDLDFFQLLVIKKYMDEALEAQKLARDKVKTNSKSTTQTYGDIKQEASIFEPVVSSSQQEIKNNSQLTTSENDTLSETITENEYNTDNALYTFCKEREDKIEKEFKDKFINTLFVNEEEEEE